MQDMMKIDFEKAKSLGVGANAEKAIQLFLSGQAGDCFTIFPQSLNPLLKALESVGLWKQVAVVPYRERNKPLYVVVKLGDTAVEGISVNRGEWS